MSDAWIAGINAVEAALQATPDSIDGICLERGSRNRRLGVLESAGRQAGAEVRHVGREELDRLAAGAHHQGVVARIDTGAVPEAADLPAIVEGAGSAALLLVLDGVTDPHNLGACLRSAAAAGVQAVIVPKDRAAGLTPTVRKVAAGGAERVPLLQVANLARTLRELKQAGVWLTGLVGDSDASLYDQDLRGPCALVVGSEGDGLRRLTRETCDFLAGIPMPGGMESLNVSVATGVGLFEAVRQRSTT